MQENKAKKELTKKQDMLYDAQRIAMTDQVNSIIEIFLFFK